MQYKYLDEAGKTVILARYRARLLELEEQHFERELERQAAAALLASTPDADKPAVAERLAGEEAKQQVIAQEYMKLDAMTTAGEAIVVAALKDAPPV